MTLYKATIQVGGPHGKNAKVQLDGVPIEFSATRVELSVDVNDVNRLTVERLVHIDEVEVEADVRFRALIARTGQHPTRWLIGEGDSPKAAIADLLSKLP